MSAQLYQHASMDILILAGGRGKRLFPLHHPPKQFRTFAGIDSLLQCTALRFLKRYPASTIHTVTSAPYEEIARHQLATIDPILADQLIVEPEIQNTARAIAFALNQLAGQLQERLLVSPSDHFLSSDELFLDQLAVASQAAQPGKHVLFGVEPRSCNPQYGYIRYREDSPLLRITQFYEKPAPALAETLIQKGCLWNTGIVLFHTETLLQQLPPIIPPLPIDQLLLERADNLTATRLNLRWSDLGSWEGIYEAFDKDARGNVIFGTVHTSNVSNCLIYADHGSLHLSDRANQVIIATSQGMHVSPDFSPRREER